MLKLDDDEMSQTKLRKITPISFIHQITSAVVDANEGL